MKKKVGRLSVMAFVPLYLFSYLAFTLNGYYAPIALGLRQDEHGNPYMAPKFGYRWLPFRDWEYKNPWFPGLMHVLYFPLVKLDLAYWHTAEDVESLDHPVRYYFDSSDNSLRGVN